MSLLRFFSIRAVPKTSWSSTHPLNFKPKFFTLLMVLLGNIVFGTGVATIVAAGAGLDPWTILAEGLALLFDVSIGMATFIVSVSVLLLWIPLRQIPGMGTIINTVVVATVIDLAFPWLPKPSNYLLQIMQVIIGIFICGLGSGIYLTGNLGPGPRDGLMTGLQRITGRPVALIRTSIEITVVILGWLLGGTVGLGTVIFALLIGPSVSVGLTIVRNLSGGEVSGE
ncbi:MAG: hypothetical protein EBZ28_03620 [Alphaproteobacteria bacterium]|nr:hypothetical protein [Alphaproteobacteria bacterium]